jgi:hypothetical protein
MFAYVWVRVCVCVCVCVCVYVCMRMSYACARMPFKVHHGGDDLIRAYVYVCVCAYM